VTSYDAFGVGGGLATVKVNKSTICQQDVHQQQQPQQPDWNTGIAGNIYIYIYRCVCVCVCVCLFVCLLCCDESVHSRGHNDRRDVTEQM